MAQHDQVLDELDTDNPKKSRVADLWNYPWPRTMPVFEKTTEATRSAFIVAGAEAKRLGHQHLGTEHFLLGVVWGHEVTPLRWSNTEEPGLTDEETLSRTGGLAAAEALQRGGDPAGEVLANLGVRLEDLRPLVRQVGDTSPEQKRPATRTEHPLTQELGKALFQPDRDRIEPADVLVKALSLPASAARRVLEALGLNVATVSERLRRSSAA
jgi:hypothetical protein